MDLINDFFLLLVSLNYIVVVALKTKIKCSDAVTRISCKSTAVFKPAFISYCNFFSLFGGPHSTVAFLWRGSSYANGIFQNKEKHCSNREQFE